jgi:nitrogen fixation protein FixH
MTKTETKKKNIYPPLILLLIGCFLIFSVWAAFQAAGLGSKVTDTDYYSKGLKYNTTQVEKRAAEVLGWNLETRLDRRVLEFYLTDHEGGEVTRAVGFLYLAIPGAAENIHLPLEEVASGHYRVRLDDNISGTIQARLEVEREGARLNRQLLLNL